MTAREPPFHHRRGFAPPKAVREAIAKLDATRDAQRIVQLLLSDEFPFDLVRANELALFHTFGSRSISTLLHRTGQFERAGQKRYDDTRLLIGHLLECGLDDEVGRRALERMNQLHARFRIPNDDFLFVLWTFIDFPIQWMGEFAHRAMTPHEQTAWFNCWVNIGEKMALRDLPSWRSTSSAWPPSSTASRAASCAAPRRRQKRASARVTSRGSPSWHSTR